VPPQPRTTRSEIDHSPLPWRPAKRLTAAQRFEDFATKFLVIPKGKGSGQSMVVHDFQCDLVASVLDADPRPAIGVWCLPRGQGKSTLLSALGLYSLAAERVEGTSVVVVAVTELQAGIIFNAARRMVELSEHLARRIVIYKDRLVIPAIDASFQVLPASSDALQGLAPRRAFVDEIGYVNNEVWEAITLATGKWDDGLTVGIGTPGTRLDNVLAKLRQYSIEHPEDTGLVYREHSAAGFEDHEPACPHCIRLANPAVAAGFLNVDAVATLAATTSEGAFRRARLCQAVSTVENPLVDEATWDGLCVPDPIPDGAEVVLGLDGSWGGNDADSTALVLATISPEPHVDLYRCWENDGTPHWRVPILEVEDAIREACKRWRVKEIAADPFRLGRTLAVLAGEGHRVTEFPFSPPRVTRATTDLHSALVGGKLSHTGDLTLTRHVLSTQVHEDGKGALRIGKVNRRRGAAKIDACSALLIAHSRSTWLASKPTKRKRYASR
jgi:phage terminase large subunit-like protein